MNVFDKIDLYFSNETDFYSKKLSSIEYKGIDWQDLIIKFGLNEFINSEGFINKVKSTSNLDYILNDYKKEMNKVINNKYSLVEKIKIVFKDVIRFIYYKWKNKNVKKEEFDFLFFITNKKFIKYVQPLSSALKKTKNKTAFIFWNENDIPVGFKESIVLPQPVLPYFWNKNYFKYKNSLTLVDRVYGYLPMIKGKQVFIPEGCLLEHHIIGKLSNKYNFKTYCLQWGFFGRTTTKAGWRNMPYSIFFVWGKFFKYQFYKYNTIPEFIESGHISLSPKITTKVNENTVLFAVQNTMGDHITEKNIFNFIDFAIGFADKNSDTKVIIRSHPDFPIPKNILKEHKGTTNILWHNYKTNSLNESLSLANYCITISSTLGIESVAYGCFPIYLKFNDLPLQLHDVFEVSSNFKHILYPEELKAYITELNKINYKTYISKLKFLFFSAFGEKAVEKIINRIL